MIKHIWSLLCATSTINQENNTLSIRDVLETITIALKPKSKSKKNKKDNIILPIGYELTSFFTREKKTGQEKAEIEVVYLGPQGEVLKKNVNQLVFKEGIKRLRARLKFNGLMFKKSGEYNFRISLKQGDQKKFQAVALVPLDIFVKVEKN